MIEFICTLIISYTAIRKVTNLVAVERTIRRREIKWLRPIEPFDNYKEFVNEYSASFLGVLPLFALNIWWMSITTITSTGVAVSLYFAINHSLSAYVNKNLDKFR